MPNCSDCGQKIGPGSENPTAVARPDGSWKCPDCYAEEKRNEQ